MRGTKAKQLKAAAREIAEEPSQSKYIYKRLKHLYKTDHVTRTEFIASK